MRTWILLLPLFIAAAPAGAAETVVIAGTEARSEQATPAGPAATRTYKARRLPRGDLRHCLEKKDSRAIIACAERRRKD